MFNRFIFSFVLCFVIVFAGITSAHASESLTIEPAQVEIGIFYGGQNISVKGLVPSGQNCVLRITGENQPLHLKKKGKVWGFLWMNVKNISYENVPNLYFIRSSDALSAITSAQTLEDLHVGYDALKSEIAPDPLSDEHLLFGEMIKLKEREGLFSIKESSITRIPGENGMDSIETKVEFPPKARVGVYKIELISFKDGEYSVTGADTITLARSPSIRFLSSLAINNGLLYGCIAVFIALGSGLLTGVIFGMGGKAH